MDEFEELIKCHETMVFRTLARLTGERDGLEDMAQEVFLRLFRALPHFQKRSRLTTFLYRIVVNVVNDEWRRRGQTRRMVPIDEAARTLVYPAPGPEDLLEQSRFQAALERALIELPLHDRTILTLHYQEGRRYGEIAAILELPMGTVKTHLHRARERLKTAMAEWVLECKTKR